MLHRVAECIFHRQQIRQAERTQSVGPIKMNVSLVINTFNQPVPLAKALAGAILQTRQADEILVADDGSDEATRNIVLEFARNSPA
ncbi:MAG: glycosyltransferase, partial [Limisphaerales bacterium]